MTESTASHDPAADGSGSGLPGASGRWSLVPESTRARVARARSTLRGVERRHVAIVACAVLAVWIAWVFAARASDAAHANQVAAALREQNAVLRERVEAGRREVELIQSDAFLAVQARAYGMGNAGRDGERAFSLTAGARPAPTIIPLGEDVEARATSPLEDWLDLLFGS